MKGLKMYTKHDASSYYRVQQAAYKAQQAALHDRPINRPINLCAPNKASTCGSLYLCALPEQRNQQLRRSRHYKLFALVLALLAICCTPLAAQAKDAGIEWETLNASVITLYQQGQYNHATLFAQRALEISERNAGRGHPDTATSLNNLAALYDTLGNYKKAEPLYRRAIQIRINHFGRKHPLTAVGVNNLATLLYEQKKYKQAEPLFLNALSVLKEKLGEDDASVITLLENLSDLYRATNRPLEAESFALHATEMRNQGASS
ncbi:hypothetical protein HDN1F_12990 [gamma proteobacterium HdN1]|nr:hypothetical protein HDN1F_12990 [gamma proteobacterium HdN1]